MPIQLDFSSAEEQRIRITQQQQAYISNLYRQAAKEVGKLAEKAPRVPSDAIRQQYLHTLQGQIEDQLKDIEGQLNSEIRSSMSSVAKATVADAKTFLKENGLPIKGAYSHVPADIVQSVASGQLYSGNWTLSKALWLHTAGTQQDVQSIVAQGIIQNKSAYDIAKDLEKYVNPDARKDWEWSKVYPGTSKVVDYNAQRLARTMVSHAYQQAFVRTTKNNPFVEKYKWEASGGERMCEICEERNGKLFDKDDFPLDHPNGMCTFTAVMDNLETIGERLGDWAAGKDDPELDKWAEDTYGVSDFGTPKSELFNEGKQFITVQGNKDDVQGYSDRLLAQMGGVQNIPRSQLEALSNYVGDSYRAFNSVTKGGTYKPGATSLTRNQVKAQVKDLNNLIRSSTLPEDLMLYRGAPVKQFAKSRSQLLSMIGQDITFDRFGSTSMSKEIADDFVEYNSKGRNMDMVLVQIKAPQGCNACLATSIQRESTGRKWLDESEVLFASDQKYRIESFDGDTLILEVLTNG